MKRDTIRSSSISIMFFKVVNNKLSQMWIYFLRYEFIFKMRNKIFFSYIITNFLKLSFNSLIAWIKVKPSDFNIKQKWFLYKNKALFLSVNDLGKTLVLSKHPTLKLFALQNGWILALVNIFDRFFFNCDKI